MIRDISMDFEPCLKVHTLISVQHKSIKLGQMIHLNVIFHLLGSNYRLVKIWNLPQFLAQPRKWKPFVPMKRKDTLLISFNVKAIIEKDWTHCEVLFKVTFSLQQLSWLLKLPIFRSTRILMGVRRLLTVCNFLSFSRVKIFFITTLQDPETLN